jgi:hypothetical protein
MLDLKPRAKQQCHLSKSSDRHSTSASAFYLDIHVVRHIKANAIEGHHCHRYLMSCRQEIVPIVIACYIGKLPFWYL